MCNSQITGLFDSSISSHRCQVVLAGASIVHPNGHLSKMIYADYDDTFDAISSYFRILRISD